MRGGPFGEIITNGQGRWKTCCIFGHVGMRYRIKKLSKVEKYRKLREFGRDFTAQSNPADLVCRVSVCGEVWYGSQARLTTRWS
jgi:hypothetical protein